MSISTYPAYELQPRKLTAEETANPYIVIQDLFDYGHLPELRNLLWHWFRITLLGSYHKGLNRDERFDIINMFEHVEKLIEAAHVIHTGRGGWAKSAHFEKINTTGDELTRLITLTVRPLSIFRFIVPGTPHTLLLVLLPDSMQTPLKNSEAILQLACAGDPQLSFCVQQAGELYHKLEEGHLFYTTVCNYANRLYDAGSPALPLLSKGKITEIQTNASAQLTIAESRASSFLAGARNYIHEDQYSMAAFMLQQAVEQLLRAAVSILMGQDVKTHSISTLLKYTRYCLPQVNQLLTLPHHQEFIPLLDKVYIDARYGSFFISPGQAAALEQLVTGLLHATTEYITAVIEGFGTQPPQHDPPSMDKA